MESKTIYQKLLEFQMAIETIKKDGANSFFKKPDGKASTYATLPNILAEVKPLLNLQKLVLTQPIIGMEVKTIITDTESKETVESGITIPNNLNAQQIGSAITYFRRYTLSSLLSLEIDEDDDGNKASQKPPEKKPEMTIEYATNFIKDSASIDELVKRFKSLSPAYQTQLKQLATDTKLKLTPQ